MDKEDKKQEDQAKARYYEVKHTIDSVGWGIFINDYVNPILNAWSDICEIPVDFTPEQMKLEIDARRNAISRLREVIDAFKGEVVQYEDNTLSDKKDSKDYIERL